MTNKFFRKSMQHCKQNEIYLLEAMDSKSIFEKETFSEIEISEISLLNSLNLSRIIYLMPFKHVQSQKHIHGLVLKDWEWARQKIILDLDLGHVDASYDSLGSNTLGNAGPTTVNQPHYVASFSGSLKWRHYSKLRTHIDSNLSRWTRTIQNFIT